MAGNNIAFIGRKSVNISEIWTAQHPLMLSWLAISFIGLVALYLAMSLPVMSI